MLNVRSIKSADFKGHFSADFGQIYPNFRQKIFFNKKSTYSACFWAFKFFYLLAKKSSKNVKKRLQEKRHKGHFGANLAFSTQNLKKQKFSIKKPYIFFSIHTPLKKDLMTRIWEKKLAPSVTLLGNKNFQLMQGSLIFLNAVT